MDFKTMSREVQKQFYLLFWAHKPEWMVRWRKEENVVAFLNLGSKMGKDVGLA